jgi:hypothetical protein
MPDFKLPGLPSVDLSKIKSRWQLAALAVVVWLAVLALILNNPSVNFGLAVVSLLGSIVIMLVVLFLAFRGDEPPAQRRRERGQESSPQATQPRTAAPAPQATEPRSAAPAPQATEPRTGVPATPVALDLQVAFATRIDLIMSTPAFQEAVSDEALVRRFRALSQPQMMQRAELFVTDEGAET